MTKQNNTAINPTREQNYPEWYQQIIYASDLAEHSPVRGCMIIKPYGYAIWEKMQKVLDEELKATGHKNAYFPLLIPLSQIEQEAKHIDGFAKECAVVTHQRLEVKDGKLIPAGKLNEPYIIRPTSETIIGSQFAKWIQSYRDLPLLINQWANVMRWEMRTRMFLRTSEFLWQEGHTAHANKEEALAETMKILEIYRDFAENTMAMPVIAGEKTPEERFPGADKTFTIEAMMQDGKALQAGTSHFLGQHFSKSFDIKFTDEQGDLKYAWTTSWGVSTRLIGGLIMTHSDDNGLVLPPKLAPIHVVILPIYKKEEDKTTVLTFCDLLKSQLSTVIYNNDKLIVELDNRDINAGEKNWQYIKKGVPIRLEIGPRDVTKDSVFMGRRDFEPKQKTSLPTNQFLEQVTTILDEIQNNIYTKAVTMRNQRTVKINNFTDFKDYFKQKNAGFVECASSLNQEIESMIKPMQVSARCISLQDTSIDNNSPCIFTGEPGQNKVIYARAY